MTRINCTAKLNNVLLPKVVINIKYAREASSVSRDFRRLMKGRQVASLKISGGIFKGNIEV